MTLHSACEYGDLAQVHRLLKTATKEDLEATDDSGRTPLLLAAASLKHLRKHENFDDPYEVESSDEGETIATPEVKEQNQDLKFVANEGAHRSGSEAEYTVNEVTDDAGSVLMSREAEILHQLLLLQLNVDHQDENGWTALHHACFVQNDMAIKMLIHAGARPMRESYGLLPQDLLRRGHTSEWVAQAQDLKDSLDQITTKSNYVIKLLAFRPSGIVQLDMVEYDVPETHSVKDYVQMLVSEEGSQEIKTGSFHYVPAGGHGQMTISTKDIPSASIARFVYVKCDINTMSREVVASGCNAVVQASVGEIFQYELFLYERVVEVESVSEFEFVDQPLIVLKRIGIVVGEDIDWVTIHPDNHIVAVNDIRVDAMEFVDAVRVLQENNGKTCIRLLMQNYSACGDFIPEKILGVGVVGKYAYLRPIGEEQQLEDVEHTYESWVRDCSSGSDEMDDIGGIATDETSASRLEAQEFKKNAEVSSAPTMMPQAMACEKVNKVMADDNKDTAVDAEEKCFTTIETVLPLHNSRELVSVTCLFSFHFS
ncbi:hypothetical protein PsorP6_005429 [Peronosclerospora sorghi]|uniref:Uncharacterized protein n=1 Tax=Peronosclerospora sorghi TaxID=230839 RepID=A0ACC0W3T9_9STRA|nr:hypothetical protein PsorP6_005429 [Peronosclerospora sorghi]